LISFPGCKINLGLSVIDKRSDGYHNLETIFYPLPVTDALEIVLSSPSLSYTNMRERGEAIFSTSGLIIDGTYSDNLCVKAYALLQKDFTKLPSIQMHLHKSIPMGAGLGGGSADGAVALLLLNTLNNLQLSKDQLLHYALLLGSDCPFFIINTPCFGTGRGEVLEPVSLDLSGYSFILVNPGIPINTGWAFSMLTIAETTKRHNIKKIVSGNISTWKDMLVNDFEKPVFEKYPEIKAIKDQLYHHGALYASMTGSGSTVFGLFDSHNVPDIGFATGYRVIKVKT
jgi:4-diphosphocytidyl-2-C-methyl-D-erythritol kinase